MNETVQNYAIFVDSSADLTPDLLSDGKLQMVAMSYTNGAENCELAEIASDSLMKSFYDGQRKGNLTRTSQVSPQQFIDAFTPVLQSGRDILYISLSGGLTNTKDSFHLANQILSSEYPDSRIIEVDSLSATGGIGLLAEEAIANREAGMSFEENVEKIRELRHEVCHVFMVEDLMYLKRGGRIPAASAIVGSVLSIKPILVMTAASLIPIVGLFGVQGYALEWARLTAWGVDSSPKQKNVDVGGCITSGARAFVVSLGLCLAVSVAMGIFTAVFSAFPDVLGILLGSLASLVSSLVTLVSGSFVLACQLRSAIYEQIGAGYRVDRVFEMIKRDTNGFARLVLLNFLCGLAVSVVVFIFIIIIVMVAAPVIMMAANSGCIAKIGASKSFTSSSFHVSIGCLTISLQHFDGVFGTMAAYASRVLTATEGFTTAR